MWISQRITCYQLVDGAALWLNQNYEIVDRVKEIVFKGEKYKGKEIGTVTIFQNDLRVSTNVTDAEGNRAIGTRVSQEVHDGVLLRGVPWVGRAFVVNHWYITAYEPIRNIASEIIGLLYVGMLEKPYIDLRNSVMLTFTGIAALCTIILLIILFFITSSITDPLRRMVLATNGTLVTEEIARKMMDAGIQRVSISIDGMDAKSHDAFRNVPSAFTGALTGIEAMKKAALITM